MSNNSSFVFSNGLNIKVTEETKYNILYDEIDNKTESLNGIFPVISINSNVYADSSVLSEAENLILANTSKVAFINTTITTDKVYSIFADNNSQIFTDFNSNLSSIKSVKSLGNNLINFPHLTVKDTKILQPQIKTNYIYQDGNWQSITICADAFKDFYPNNHHLTYSDLKLSPKFLNNGDVAFWGMNQNQRILNDINLRLISGNAFNGFEYDKTTNTFTATDTSLCGIVKIMDVVNSLPRDLNGHSLNIMVSGAFPNDHRYRPGYVSSAAGSAYPFVLSGFFGGEVNITGHFCLEMPTEIKNCDNVTFENWHCWADKGACLNLTNCKNISFLSSYIESWNIINDVAMNIDNSSVYITSSNFHFTSGHVPLYWKGKAINNSQVFIDGTCNTYMETKNADGTGRHTDASELDYFPKFQLSDNSMCTWLDDSIPWAKLGLYSQNEFNGITGTTTNLTEDIFIGNHLHQNVPEQFLPPTEPPGGGSGGSGDGDGEGGDSGGSGSDPSKELYTIDNTLPVGATFYWPRAFTIPFDEVSGISGKDGLPGSTYFFHPPDTVISSDYQKSASSVLIPFMTRSNSIR